MMKEKLEACLKGENRTFLFQPDKEQLVVTEQNKKITLQIPQIIHRFEEEGESALQNIVYYVNEGFRAENLVVDLKGHPEKIFPVIRAASFPKSSKQGEKFISTEHTAETAIYYVFDNQHAYRFITEKDINKANFQISDIKKIALHNICKLETTLKKDHVGKNDFYFMRANDGYDASRLLNAPFLEKLKQQFQGEMVLSIPHQDVLIIADIKDDSGYDVLAHMTMQFFAEGFVPITSLPFVYHHGKLEPIFIMAKNRPKE